MAGRDATCIRYQNSFKPDMDAYHGHAQLLEKIGVILCMYKNRPCSTEFVWICHTASSKSILFLDIIEMTPIIFHGLV
jgi:hypothetical protein